MTKCECGCGQEAPLAKRNVKAKDQVAGTPLRFIHGHNGRKRECILVDPISLCWVWMNGISNQGYGVMWKNGRQVRAHREYYEREHGPIANGLTLDHLCRNRACVNPAHLEPVTNRENVRRGAAIKLTSAKALEIRALCGQGWLQIDIAAAYGVDPSTVTAIKKRRIWA